MVEVFKQRVREPNSNQGILWSQATVGRSADREQGELVNPTDMTGCCVGVRRPGQTHDRKLCANVACARKVGPVGGKGWAWGL